MTKIYYRYRLDDGRFWGDTDVFGDDPECGYLETSPPVYEPMEHLPVWTGSAWVIHDYSTGYLGDPL